MTKTKGEKRIYWALVTFVTLGFFFTLNWCYHVIRKPSELIGLADVSFYKRPEQTWLAYGPQFEEYSTKIITPEFLAALAQTETHGNTIARTYWKWNFSAKNPFDFYAPASSAVGLFQITDGTFAEAKHYCIRRGQVVQDGPWYAINSCWFNTFYNRLVPRHSIEMTSAYLHLNVDSLITRNRLHHVTLEQKQDLAAVIHLCGVKHGERFVHHHFHYTKNERCGNLSPRDYVSQVKNYKKKFTRIIRNQEINPEMPQEKKPHSPNGFFQI